MKLLIATGLFPPDIGGPATYSKLLSDELPRHSIDVIVESFGSVRQLPKIIRHAVFFFRVLWAARAADVIFAQDTVSVGLPALLAANLLGKTFIVRVPGDYAWEQAAQRYGVKESIDGFQSKRYGRNVERLRSIQRFVVHMADRIIAPSAYLAAIVAEWGVPQERIRTIYNGIDLAEVREGARGSVSAGKLIVSAGRLVPWKGFAMLIEALEELPGWRLEIVGDGPERERLLEQIERQGMQDRVSLSGRMPRGELIRKIAGASIFALNTAYEGLSHQIIEVMAAGTPVITTAIGGNPELIDDGRTGMLIAPDDRSAFVRAVRRLEDASFRSGLVSAARDKAESFSIRATVVATVQAVKETHAAMSDSVPRKHRIAKLVRYLFSGGMAAVTNLVLLWLFTDVCHIWYLLSSILAFLIAFGVSFVLQKFFTFQDHATEGIHGQAAAYFAVTGTNLLVNTGLMYLFVDIGHMNYLLAQVAASIIIAVEGYVVYNIFIFKKQPHRR